MSITAAADLGVAIDFPRRLSSSSLLPFPVRSLFPRTDNCYARGWLSEDAVPGNQLPKKTTKQTSKHTWPNRQRCVHSKHHG